jgi:hypothetical protein
VGREFWSYAGCDGAVDILLRELNKENEFAEG